MKSRSPSGSTGRKELPNWSAGFAISVTRAKSTVCHRLFRVRVGVTLIFPSPIDLTEPIDVYSEWIDAADAAQRDEHVPRRTAASSSNRPVQVTGDAGSDDDE